MTPRLPRLGVVISHPIQHFAPLFRELARRALLDLKVFYCCDWGVESYLDPGFGVPIAWDVPLLDGYDHDFLPIRRRPRALGFWDIDNPEAARYLDTFDPDAVWVHGYAHRTSWRVLRWARGRAKVLFFGDSELLAQRSLFVRAAKRLILPRVYRRCDAFLTIGDNNEAYYRHYGVPADRLFRGAFPVDIRRFRARAAAITTAERDRMRRTLGLSPEALVVLFVGKMIAIKRPLDLVRAVGRLTSETPPVQALFVGTGELEPVIRREVRQCGLQDQIQFAGFVNQEQMPGVLHCGDVLAMCSEKDPHPLAVTEAMAVGNAVVASDRVGCVGPTDAARPNVNALVYPCGDTWALAQHLRHLAQNRDLLDRMQDASRQLADTQDISVAAVAVETAIQRLLQTAPVNRQ